MFHRIATVLASVIVPVLLACGVLVTVDSSASAAPAAARDPLEGVWRFQSVEVNGNSNPGPAGYECFFHKGQAVFREDGRERAESAYRVDWSQAPATIDVVDKIGQGETLKRGILALDGQTLRWCCAIWPDGPRPTALATQPGDGNILRVLVRVPESAAATPATSPVVPAAPAAADRPNAQERPTEAMPFTGLGDLPGGDVFSRANGISADGQTVVGCSESQHGSEAFRWTRRAGMVGLGDLDGGAFKSTATAASANGSVVVGCGAVAGSPSSRAFRWTASGGLVPLPDHPSGTPYEACDVSADGTIVAGTFQAGGSGTQAFTWSESGGYQLLESKVTIASKTFTALTDVFSLSGDGRIAVGYVKFNQIDFLQACIWVDGQGEPLRRSEFNAGVPYYLQDFIGTRTICAAVAKDCVAVIGRYENKQRLGCRGFHIADGKLTWLESANGSITWPLAISGDGRTVVGRGVNRTGKEVACLWRQGLGVQPLAQHLASVGITVGDWMLGEATGVSQDGRVILGNGVNPKGQREAWIARLPGTADK